MNRHDPTGQIGLHARQIAAVMEAVATLRAELHEARVEIGGLSAKVEYQWQRFTELRADVQELQSRHPPS